MEYRSTLSSAQGYAKNGKLEDWVHSYLLSDANNEEFSNGLKLFDRYFLGPIKMPLSLFYRCCGPEENMKWKVDAEWFEKKVAKLENAIKTDSDMPPLIAHFVENAFELNDGNHRLEAYSRLGRKEINVIIWVTEKHEYELFLSKYSEYLK
ncbi:MAG: ParB/RepB/Spo0J family partition protein [Erysipelotrichaceae bacterium]|nr:ParB/RepB/Spo0J family partition protein [Erysipelotrichaceae bacterium]